MKLNLVLVSMTIGVALAGCGFHLTDPPEDQSRLALACETTKCDCQPPKPAFSFSTPPSEPVRWRPDGAAYCREGWLLNRAGQ